jgi:predicted peptidase
MVAFESADDSPLKEYCDPDTYQALLWKPSSPSAGPMPLLIHLHGAGEAGSQIWGIIAEGQTGTPLVELHFGRAPQMLADNFK